MHIWIPWVSFCLPAPPNRRSSSLKAGSCSFLGALAPLGYCRATAVTLHLQDGFLTLVHIRAPWLGLRAEAGGQAEAGGRKGYGSGEGTDGRTKTFVACWSLDQLMDLQEFAEEVF